MASYDIFISYRRKDSKGRTSGTNIARAIKQQLEIDGYRNKVFFDYSEISDGEFEQTILPALEGSKVLLLILSKEALQRCVNEDDWVRREVIHAIKHNVKIIPVNPDYNFDGYPEGFPKELDIIRRTQHQCIHMDSSFELDVKNLIDKRIAPVVPPKGRSLRLSVILSVLAAILLVAGMLIVNKGKTFTPAQADSSPVEAAAPAEVQEKPAELSVEEIFAQGRELLDQGSYEEAFPLLLSASEKGLAQAQYILGVCYENGQGTEKNHAEAVAWYLKAAEQGQVDAQSSLGYCYSEGIGVEKDYAEAAQWYLKAAEQGHATSQYNVGIFFSRGQGVKQDHKEAAKWYHKVAEQGYAAAQYILGLCYERGQGVAKDKVVAAEWYRKAAAQGHEKASESLTRLGY